MRRCNQQLIILFTIYESFTSLLRFTMSQHAASTSLTLMIRTTTNNIKGDFPRTGLDQNKKISAADAKQSSATNTGVVTNCIRTERHPREMATRLNLYWKHNNGNQAMHADTAHTVSLLTTLPYMIR